ncbi:hypothetical protein GGI19_006450 [Coemansia pectinata]|uniref:Nucleolus and neural progenitor protein-like N-terminal domain-containing protein n=1 Tax=Coemansia pectinata TaxID=1052879 RepID=A0A9W8L8D5_9FUNG|nr:hypothetical protein GGI19_006450 [Coemansia pectinata]
MSFGGRSCVLPECHSVPRSKFALATATADDERTAASTSKAKRQQIENPVYRNVSKWNHTQSLSEFMKLGATFLRPEVGHDRALLGRVFYRNWNQHRTAVYFRRLYELRRGLRVLEQAGLRELIEQIAASFYEAGASKSSRKISMWQALPCQHFVTAAAVRISHLAQLAVKLQEICWNTFMHFAAQTAQTLFMPLALVVQGISARLFIVFGLWQQDLIAMYVLLLQWLPSLPACPDSLNGLTPAIAAQLIHVDELTSICSRSTTYLDDSATRAKISQVATESTLKSTAAERLVELDAMDVDSSSVVVLPTATSGNNNNNNSDSSATVEDVGQQRSSKKRARQRAVDLYADD